MSYGKPTVLIARSGYGSPQPGPAPMAGVTDKIGDFLKGVGTGVVNFYGQAQRDAGAAAALQQQQAAQSSTPSWLLPAVLVGGGVVLILLLKRPRKNPAGNHRRRRRSRRSLR
jgi:hypothetical protein